VVLATTRLDVNKTVRGRLGVRKASFASADETREITGQMIGGVTVFALPPDLPVWVDSRVMGRDRIILGGGSRSCKVLAPPSILERLPNVSILDGLALESPPPA
jgi:prolyl-tRNA editing enzyme YbaK/EbsC (Cys-tRNA(Pro) deacylase)